METQTFKLLGLNKKTTSGVYATVECGKEDSFHCDFDEELFSKQEQDMMFDYMKDLDQSFADCTVVVEYSHLTNGVPINPIIREITIV